MDAERLIKKLERRALLFADHYKRTKDGGIFIYGKVGRGGCPNNFNYSFIPLFWLREDNAEEYQAYEQLNGMMLSFLHSRNTRDGKDWHVEQIKKNRKRGLK